MVVIISTVSPITTPDVALYPSAGEHMTNVVLPPLNVDRVVSDRRQELAASAEGEAADTLLQVGYFMSYIKFIIYQCRNKVGENLL